MTLAALRELIEIAEEVERFALLRELVPADKRELLSSAPTSVFGLKDSELRNDAQTSDRFHYSYGL